MRCIDKYLLIILLLFSNSSLYARKSGQALIDSLLQELPHQRDDTGKVMLLIQMSFNYYAINPNEGINYGRQGLELSKKLAWKRGIASTNICIGINYQNKPDNENALVYYTDALKTDEEIGNKKGIAQVAEYIGNIHKSQGDYPGALDNYFRSLRMREEVNDKPGIASVYGSIGNIFDAQGDFAKALEYDFKGLKIDEEAGEKSSIAVDIGNIGNVYQNQGDYPHALAYDLKALKLDEELGFNASMANTSGNIGVVYSKQKQYQLATEYYNKALSISKQMGNKLLVAIILCNMGGDNLSIIKDESEVPGKLMQSEKTRLLSTAIEDLQEALEINKAISSPEGLQSCYRNLADAYSLNGDYKKAFECESHFTAIKDSVYSKENNEKIMQMSMKNEYDRLRLTDSLKTSQKEKINHIQLQRQRAFTWIGIAVVLLLSGFTFTITRNNKLLNREKQKSELLLKEITVKNKEITDNINYAQRIQSAILPDTKMIYRELQQSFILFLPKDIVSGDFYAFAEKDNRVIIIAGDCTGHGVSGAFMSMIGSSLLNQIINEKGTVEPSEILSQLNVSVIDALKQSENESNDGMDISICSFNVNKNELEYAGANRPLWLVRDMDLKVYKPDKFPIGGQQAAYNRTFTNHKIQLQEKDTVYIFSDGYADQFGGENGKKLLSSKFKDVLLSIQQLDMRQQEQHLKDFFDRWKGTNEQVDDVLVIGVRV